MPLSKTSTFIFFLLPVCILKSTNKRLLTVEGSDGADNVRGPEARHQRPGRPRRRPGKRGHKLTPHPPPIHSENIRISIRINQGE